MNDCAMPGYCLNLAFWARPMLWADDSWRPGSGRSPMILGSTMAVQFTHYWAQYESSRGLLIATALLLSALMTGFRFHNLAMASWLKNPLLICSRYSLEIYFFHLTALKLYHLAQGG